MAWNWTVEKAASELFGLCVTVMPKIHGELDREVVRRDAAWATMGLLDG